MALASTSNSRTSLPALDPSVIDGFASIMAASDVSSLVRDMERDVRLRVERLAGFAVNGDSLGEIAQDSHDLRSLGGNFGLAELSACAGPVERAARGGRVETVARLLPGLITAGRRSLTALARRPEFGECAS